MKHSLRFAALPALAVLLALPAAPAGFAQDAMAPAADAMATGDAMAPMTDEELKACLDKAGTDQMAMDACHAQHNGDAMAPDAMAPTDSMAPADAMAPVAQ